MGVGQRNVADAGRTASCHAPSGPGVDAVGPHHRQCRAATRPRPGRGANRIGNAAGSGASRLGPDRTGRRQRRPAGQVSHRLGPPPAGFRLHGLCPVRHPAGIGQRPPPQRRRPTGSANLARHPTFPPYRRLVEIRRRRAVADRIGPLGVHQFPRPGDRALAMSCHPPEATAGRQSGRSLLAANGRSSHPDRQPIAQRAWQPSGQPVHKSTAGSRRPVPLPGRRLRQGGGNGLPVR